MNKEFEKAFPEKSIFEYVDYDHECSMYGSKENVSGQELIGLFTAIANLNGAWWAWSYQQKRIDEVLNLVCKLQYSSGERIYGEVKELLK